MGAQYVSCTSIAISSGSPSGGHTVTGAQRYMLVYIYTGRNTPTVTVTYAGLPMTQLGYTYNASEAKTHYLFGLANPPQGSATLAGSLSSYSGGYMHALNSGFAYDLNTDYGHSTYAGTAFGTSGGTLNVPAVIEGITWVCGKTITQFSWSGGGSLINDGTEGVWYKQCTASTNEQPISTGNNYTLLGVCVKGAAMMGQPISITPFLAH